MLLAAVPEAHPRTAQSDLPAARVAVPKTGKSKDNRASRTTGAIAGALPGLCFQPGIGWRHVLIREPDGFVTRGTSTSLGPREDGSASGANPPLGYSRRSRVRQAQSVECSEASNDKNVTEGSVENFTVRNRPRAMQSAGQNAGPLTSLRVHSPYYPNGSTGSGTLRTPANVTPPTGFAEENRSGTRSNRAGDPAFHAYLSSVKLRRLLRNTPDFRTRIKLQQLQNNPTGPSHAAGAGVARGALNNDHGSRTSSPGFRRHDRPHGSSQSLGVRP